MEQIISLITSKSTGKEDKPSTNSSRSSKIKALKFNAVECYWSQTKSNLNKKTKWIAQSLY